MKVTEADRLRQVVHKHLKALSDDLGDFEQTTHARFGGGTIDDVAQVLVAAYNGPTGYTVSNLDQAIRALLKNG